MTVRIVAPLLLALYAAVFLAPGFFSLPPLDRDESRFAQASKQMLETGDFISIRFNDEARNKKPVGIYWMQAASAAAMGGPAAAPIWAYRIPSAIGALLAIAFTYLAGAALFERRVALIGASLFAISVLMVSEGHIGKTDALLCAATAATQAGLARAFMRHRRDPDCGARWREALLVWGGLGCGALLKGPVGAMVAVLTVLAVWMMGGGLAWVRKTKPWPGVLVAAAIFLPWAVLITLETGWTFWSDAIWGDMLSKAVAGRESHGSPPGLYLALVAVTLFPASIALVPAAWRTVRNRREGWAMFLIAWAVPAWLAFELFPTKLPHYVLPMYPALALAIGAYIAARIDGAAETAPRWARIANVVLWSIGAAAFAGLIVAIPYIYGGGAFRAADVLLALAALAASGWLLTLVARQSWTMFVPAAALASALTCGIVFEHTLSAADDLMVSRRAAEGAVSAGYRPGLPITAAGYTEPSLVFMTATDIDLAPDGAAAAAFMAAHPGGFALIEAGQLDAFLEGIGNAGVQADRMWSIDGFNYSRGRKVTIALYRGRGRS